MGDPGRRDSAPVQRGGYVSPPPFNYKIMDLFKRERPLRQPVIDDFKRQDLQMLSQSIRFLSEEQVKVLKEYKKTNDSDLQKQLWIQYKTIESDIRFCENGIERIIRYKLLN